MTYSRSGGMDVAPLFQMQTTENFFCRQIVEILQQHGIRHAYCSPGSRNTPLLLAMECCHGIEKRVVVDERSAAFQALGCAMVERTAVALVCTSGTAVLNYSPAVAEAYYSGIPLIVISADRPKEWIDQDDSQTIHQFGVLDHIVKGSYDIRAIPEGKDKEYTDEVRWTVNRTVNEAVLKSYEGKPGPVHINVQLSDPLGVLCDDVRIHERCIRMVRPAETLMPDIVRSMASEIVDAKVLLVAGFGLPDHRMDKAVRRFASLPNVTVLAETISNLHDPQPLSGMIDSVLCRMNNEEKERMRPDIVISMGGALVSRMLKQYLREYPPVRHWSVGHSNYFCDCFRSMTDKVDISPAIFLKQLYGAVRKSRVKIESSYSSLWLGKRKEAMIAGKKYIENAPWSDLKALDYIFRNTLFDNLFVSNGTVVRYSQLIPHACHAEYCNRGVSGIDGCTSVAVGGADSYPGDTLLISGDMSWMYDSGASALCDVPSRMKMIVMDNAGGGIFRFVRSTSSVPADFREKYLCIHDLPDIGAVAGAYGIESLSVGSMEELQDGIEWLNSDSDLPRILIVTTPPEESAEILRSYFEFQ